MASLYEEYPQILEEGQLDHVLDSVKDWTIAHGLAIRPPSDFVLDSQDAQGVTAISAPVTLFPSLFPKNCFDEATVIQKAYNELYARISMDEVWLGNIIQELAKVDDFIEKLWNIHQRVKKEGYVQPLALGLFRSDYMIHVHKDDTIPQIRQVEFNTISTSFGGLSTQVSSMHRYLLRNAIYHADGYLKNNTLPPNDTTASLVQGLITAHQAYNISSSKSELSKCILFVVQQPERNIFDQRLLEYALQAKYITTFRLPFALTMKHTQISDNEERLLIYTPPHSPTIRYEVSVVYFRSTYTPTEFPYENDWEARYRIERSAAIKCPSILTQLAGSKKVQQVLATPSSSHIERFLNKQDSDRVRKSFAPIYPLDNSEAGQEAKSIAMDPNRSHGYVLKPQREGGGNNIYRKAIPPFLEALGNQEKWNGHILMELIDPPSQRNYIFCNGVTKSGEVIPELGIFGTCLWSQTGQIDHNENAGYVLRTKERESEEGGVAAGFGAVDSLCLVDV